MGILEGLEKFGFDGSGMDNLFGDENTAKTQEPEKKPEQQKTAEDFITPEVEYLLEKKITCALCDRQFKEKAVKTSKMRRLQPDRDLRPRFQGVDTLKYEIISCPYCGYTAQNRYFEHLSSLQIKLIREGVCTKFTPSDEPTPETYDYDQALDRYKLALFNTVVKKGSTSEKAYLCLKMSWLCRGKAEELQKKGVTPDSETMKKCREEERKYYEQAYEGMTKAIASEHFPICGMDSNTMDLLLAAMAFELGKYEAASRMISRILISKTANRNSKDRALEMKEELIKILKSRGAI